MTRERNISFGFDDIKAVVVECIKCRTATKFPADVKVEIPFDCPHCGNSWRSAGGRSGALTNDSAMVSFVQSIPAMRTLLSEKAYGFNVLLEFDEPKE
jgi:hypothetical protein